eukprot:TRINITY_DN38401_c0_g1_i1.p1 TRINITY_DN38401_c0_g1~~TRINITY_DN38401_c0_g1_i1.p1  ORF type:complete len:103 (+),score=17.19 TRINITY_DN38401_c0_g1_i1:27-335(+)
MASLDGINTRKTLHVTIKEARTIYKWGSKCHFNLPNGKENCFCYASINSLPSAQHLENILKLRLSNHLDGVAEGSTPFKVDQFHITSGIKPSIGYYHVEDRL